MVEDIVRAYGHLTLGSRLKRLGERLQAESLEIATGMGATVQASQYPFLAALDENGPLLLGELAEAVGITQPGATRTVGQLVEKGLLETRTAAGDRRQRIISLTAKGQREVDLAKQVIWPRIAAAVTDLCNGLGGPLLDQLAALEDGLTALPLARRPANKPGERQ